MELKIINFDEEIWARFEQRCYHLNINAKKTLMDYIVDFIDDPHMDYEEDLQ